MTIFALPRTSARILRSCCTTALIIFQLSNEPILKQGTTACPYVLRLAISACACQSVQANNSPVAVITSAFLQASYPTAILLCRRHNGRSDLPQANHTQMCLLHRPSKTPVGTGEEAAQQMAPRHPSCTLQAFVSCSHVM